MLRTVSWRWSQLLYECMLLQKVSIRNPSCEDHQLKTLFTAAKQVVVIDFFNSFQLTRSCLLHVGLSRLGHLMLTGTALSNHILVRILRAWNNELMELHLVGTHIVMNTVLRAFPFSLIVKFDSFPIHQLSFLSPFASLV